ncbi:nucleotide exchange factor GrpE [candidate division TA06 bacterium]|uniref:Protein GrpE n=1 Tax=candidate division TA06 bacterium TaxID=2250710 RepID=A0A933MH74_UNCT6|nr:nucleotide exchange factor GrpE [candidate division TA06 bacterium]
MTEENKGRILYRKLKARLKELMGQSALYRQMADENFDKYLRAMADLDNYRKRTAKEYLEREGEANRNLVAKVLPVLDNLDRALSSSKELCERDESFKSFHLGVQMIDQQIHKILEAEGLSVLKSEGLPFDPTKHEAVLTVESREHAPDTVVNEVEKGFLFRDKVLRPARVAVSKLPAEPAEEAAEPQADQNDNQ